jgi:hypothetical protein
MNYQGTTLRLALNADVPRLPQLLIEAASCVRVRNLWFTEDFPLLQIVVGPFHVVEDDGHFVIHGFDRMTGLPGKARISGEVLQYCAERYSEWGQSPSWIRLYVPE